MHLRSVTVSPGPRVPATAHGLPPSEACQEVRLDRNPPSVNVLLLATARRQVRGGYGSGGVWRGGLAATAAAAVAILLVIVEKRPGVGVDVKGGGRTLVVPHGRTRALQRQVRAAALQHIEQLGPRAVRVATLVPGQRRVEGRACVAPPRHF